MCYDRAGESWRCDGDSPSGSSSIRPRKLWRAIHRYSLDDGNSVLLEERGTDQTFLESVRDFRVCRDSSCQGHPN